MVLDFGQDLFKREKIYTDDDGFTGTIGKNEAVSSVISFDISDGNWTTTGSIFQMVDNDLTTSFNIVDAQAGDNTATAFTKIDIGAKRRVRATNINFSLQGQAGRGSTCTIETSNDDTNWTTQNTQPIDAGGAEVNYDLSLGQLSYRYLRINANLVVSDILTLKIFHAGVYK